MSEQAGPSPEKRTGPVSRFVLTFGAYDRELIRNLGSHTVIPDLARIMFRGQDQVRYSNTSRDEDFDGHATVHRYHMYFNAYAHPLDKGRLVNLVALTAAEKFGENGPHYFDDLEYVSTGIQPLVESILPESEQFREEFIDMYRFALTDREPYSDDAFEAEMRQILGNS